MKRTLQIIVSAIIVWAIRVALILPFLNEDGGFTLESGKGLPPVVDYFFSTLFFALILMMFAISYYFLPKRKEQSYVKSGLQITLIFFAVFVAIDLVVEVGIFKRTIPGYIESVFIDYSPLLIPYFTGVILDK